MPHSVERSGMIHYPTSLHIYSAEPWLRSLHLLGSFSVCGACITVFSVWPDRQAVLPRSRQCCHLQTERKIALSASRASFPERTCWGLTFLFRCIRTWSGQSPVMDPSKGQRSYWWPGDFNERVRPLKPPPMWRRPPMPPRLLPIGRREKLKKKTFGSPSKMIM